MDFGDAKGQSAIEYLTTYGWMLLVVAIVGGAVFTTVQNSAQIQSVSGLTNADVRVNDYGLNSDGLQLSLRAAAASQVEIQEVMITDTETGVSADISSSEVVPVGDTAQVNLQDVQTTDTSDTYDMEITYSTGGLEGLVAEGKITGSFGVFNRLKLTDAKFNRSTDELRIAVKNSGNNATESIEYIVEANSTDYTGTLPNLDPGETTRINISTDETYPLESVNLETEGTRFVDSSSGLKCTPTKGLVGYWPFNDEQTENGWVFDLSGYENDGSLEKDVGTGVNGQAGEGYYFDGNSEVDFATDINDNRLTLQTWFREAKTGGVLLQSGFSYGDNYGGLLKIVFNGTPRFFVGNNKFGLNKNYSNKNEWNFFAGNMNSTEARIWLNGRTKSTSVSLTNSPDSKGTIGGEGDTNYYEGYLDEVRIYNRSLSQEEIQRLYKVRSEDWAVSGCRLTG